MLSENKAVSSLICWMGILQDLLSLKNIILLIIQILGKTEITIKCLLESFSSSSSSSTTNAKKIQQMSRLSRIIIDFWESLVWYCFTACQTFLGYLMLKIVIFFASNYMVSNY